jgi:hypothetical protein
MRRGRIKLTDELLASKDWSKLELELNSVFTITCRERKLYGIIELHGTSPLFDEVKEGEAPEYCPVFDYDRPIFHEDQTITGVPRFKKFERMDDFAKLHIKDNDGLINYPGLNHFEETIKKGWWDKLSNLSYANEKLRGFNKEQEDHLRYGIIADQVFTGNAKYVSTDYGIENSKPVTNLYGDWIDKKIKEGELQEAIEKARQEFIVKRTAYLEEVKRIQMREVIYEFVEGKVVSRYPEHVENIVKLIYNHIDVLKQQCEDKIAKLIKG